MTRTQKLYREITAPCAGSFMPHLYRAQGLVGGENLSPYARKAKEIEALFTAPEAFIYPSDLIVGSLRSLLATPTEEEHSRAVEAVSAIPGRWQNSDHYAPDYETVLSVGIVGLLSQIEDSKKTHAKESDRVDYLEAMAVTLRALQTRLRAHAAKAEELLAAEGDTDNRRRLEFIRANCLQVADGVPETFAQGLQLVWMIHSCFLYELRYAMALGRMDQYLFPLYERDKSAGRIDQSYATELLENVFVKIHERMALMGSDDVVNICIGGVTPDGDRVTAMNDLSYAILWAVGNVGLPGPNLSARITPDTPDVFLDECLKVIGTGLGYPALMNDEINMAALRRYGYAEADIRNYCMVGCIENFITGAQPPWDDGRFEAPRFLEYVFTRGIGIWSNGHGIDTGDVATIGSMEEFMERYEAQLRCGVEQYMNGYDANHTFSNPELTTFPFLSCFCKSCIERGLDVNMGGAKYPSVHGACLMGVGTTADALAAIEQLVFVEKSATLTEIGAAMKANFQGYDHLRDRLLAAPKYGNNNEFADKYARWFLSFLTEEFRKYHTYDGGGIYTAMAANTNNITAGMITGATPDGRPAGQPLSDAASPTYGRDVRGATSTILSVSKPDYTLAACGTVVNQKFSPSMFQDGKREKLLSLIKVYFQLGGQEIQINATSPEVLREAMEHPEKYPELVVRVSGFSARFVTLSREVQEDILARTQQE